MEHTPFDAKAFLRTLTTRPGVYRMLDDRGEVLYVGKARNLKKRVASYFTRSDTTAKTRALVRQIADVAITITNTENEALILENNLIKELRPRYNVLFRDDKSYPYIYLSSKHEFPRLGYYRGARREPGRFFGPYPSAGAVRETLNLLQKLFKVRQCEDTFYQNRSRPCLQYQIKRCSAPCVGFIDRDDYANDVRHAVMFLDGKDSQVIDELVARMEQASASLDYEQAAIYRDQIASLRTVQEKQYVSGGHGNLARNVDIIACDVANGVGCVEVFFVRGGHNLGNKSFFPKHPSEAAADEILSAFILQYYLGRDVPAEILVSHEPAERKLIESVLSEQAGSKVVISARVKGERARWLQLAME